MKEQKVLEIKAGWNAEEPFITQDGFYGMKSWQILAYQKLFGETYRFLNAPMGSGKTYAICYISAKELEQKIVNKVIISVPQAIIANGFYRANLLYPDGSKLLWEIPEKYDLCSPKQYALGSMLEIALEFLRDSDSKVLICCHQLLVYLYDTLRANDEMILLKNVSVWIDEAHHSMSTDSTHDTEISNRLGGFIRYCMDVLSSIRIGYATATAFRGDRLSLLPNTYLSKFTRFNLPWDQYLGAMRYLKSFSKSFVLCHGDMYSAITKLFKRKIAKTIIYIPPVQARFLPGDKYSQVDKVIEAIELGVFGRQKVEKSYNAEGLLTIKNHKQKITILDLVDERRRDTKKEYVGKISKSSNGPDVIISLNLFKEGADYIHLNRSIIMGHRGSLTAIVQMMGRVIRDAPGKKRAEIYQLFPPSLQMFDEGQFCKDLNDYVKAILSCMLLEEVFDPVQLNSYLYKKGVTKSNNKDEEADTGFDAMDSTTQLKLMEDAVVELTKIPPDEDVYRIFMNKIIPSLLSEYGVSCDVEEVGRRIWTRLVRETFRLKGLRVEDVNFDIVKKTKPLETLLQYTSGFCGVDTFKALRQAISKSREWRPFIAAREFVRDLKLSKIKDYRDFCKTPSRPKDIPTNPEKIYNGEWLNWADWLGTKRYVRKDDEYCSFIEFKDFIKSSGIKSSLQFARLYKLGKLPKNIPGDPAKIYASWNGWSEIFGKRFLSFEEARNLVRTLSITKASEWRQLVNSGRKPEKMPSHPNISYKNKGWVSWHDFLGTKATLVRQPLKKKLDLIKEELARFGYKLVSKSYTNLKDSLFDAICPNGHKIKIRWQNFRIGQRCKQCYLAAPKYNQYKQRQNAEAA